MVLHNLKRPHTPQEQEIYVYVRILMINKRDTNTSDYTYTALIGLTLTVRD